MINKKKLEEYFFRVLMFCSTSIIVVSLIVIIFSIFYKGFPALSWEMISNVPSGGYYFGKGGGILNAIIGSVYLSFGAVILAIAVGLPLSLFINVYLVKYRRLVNGIRFVLDLLWGVPSIVYGAFGFAVMIQLGIRASLFAGIITVALFIIPIIVRAMDEVLKEIPKGLMESAVSLGSTKSEISYRVFFKQSLAGLVTAVLLSFGRAIGDAASILFTTGYTDYIPTSLFQPAATLPLSIFFQLSSPIPEVKERAYASAAVLVLIILFISITARIIGKRGQQNKINF